MKIKQVMMIGQIRMTDTQTFTITVTSPFGTQAIDEWEHWMRKVSSEAKERWGIDIAIEKETETEDYGGFDE